MAKDKLLRVEDLKLHFKTQKGPVRAVDGVFFELGYKEAVVILGESGCGKSSLAKAICVCYLVTLIGMMAKYIWKILNSWV